MKRLAVAAAALLIVTLFGTCSGILTYGPSAVQAKGRAGLLFHVVMGDDVDGHFTEAEGLVSENEIIEQKAF